jgi:hypothetical protein
VRRGACSGRLAVVAPLANFDRLGLGGGRVSGGFRAVTALRGAEGGVTPPPGVSGGVHGPSAGLVGDTERREPGEVHRGRQ